MRKRRPSTPTLQTIEGTTRHESFSRAADELTLAQGAALRQITNLEAVRKMAGGAVMEVDGMRSGCCVEGN